MAIEQYFRPTDAAAAASLLSAPGAFALAGGTDLLVQERQHLRNVVSVVDLKRLPGLQGVEWSAQSVRIGAATPCAVLTEDAKLKQHFPGLVEAADLIGSVQIQGRCSLGGNLCNASPAADTTPALLVNQAVAHIYGCDGERQVPVAEFLPGPGITVLQPGEFLLALELPLPGPGRSDAAMRFTPRSEMDIAVANAAVSLRLDEDGGCQDLRLAIGAVGPRAILVPEAGQRLQGRQLDDAAMSELANLASAAAQPIDDKRGTVSFRRHVVGVIARRALLRAVSRLEAGS